MNDLAKILSLNNLLTKNNINPSENFETIYSQITDDGLKKEIESRIIDYFSKLSLPEHVTIYDQLLLSLREKDAIFTFNWDPFLFDAYKRNSDIVSLPQIFFLHGNVRIGACEACDKWGEKIRIVLSVILDSKMYLFFIQLKIRVTFSRVNIPP